MFNFKNFIHMKKVFNAFANRKFALVFAMLIICSASAFAQDISAGQNAMTQVTNEIQQYLPLVVNLCYALAGIFAVVGAISVYIAMNNEEQDVKKKIMMTIGACIFMVAAANALPLFFGYTASGANP